MMKSPGNVTLRSSLKRLIPSALKPSAKIVYHKAFRMWLRITFWWADHISKQPSNISLPPASLRFRVSESVSVLEFLRVGAGCANLIRQHITEMGIDLANTHRVLDFGCGCGRTIRWFLRDAGAAEFHGVDVDVDAIAWCKVHLHRGHFLVNAPAPPLPYPDQYFDVVYCLSVFTHLSESMQNIWLAELKRILKAGGGPALDGLRDHCGQRPGYRRQETVARSRVCAQDIEQAERPRAGLVSNNLALSGIYPKPTIWRFCRCPLLCNSRRAPRLRRGEKTVFRSLLIACRTAFALAMIPTPLGY